MTRSAPTFSLHRGWLIKVALLLILLLAAHRSGLGLQGRNAGESPSASSEPAGPEPDELRPALDIARTLEQRRAGTIQRVIGSVVSICDSAGQAGGSGVLIDPSGLALTNHHVVMGAGTDGLAGLADGRMRPWRLVATDPGGDLALILLEDSQPLPASRLGDSGQVRVGDWALAMGNPFALAEDHVPTVTLGIVSGVQRFQEGAGGNQLVYGNCIQVDSSINPGNSGGPLFDMSGAVIGINGRASFLERGRVNVGLGYAISANQARNFLGELMATRLAQHGTLDASFSAFRGRGILCSKINELSPAAAAGLELEDRLVRFEGDPVDSANQFTNLICTLPRDWPATLAVQKKSSGAELQICTRLTALPYPPPPPAAPSPNEPPRRDPGSEDPGGSPPLPGADPPADRPDRPAASPGLAAVLATPPGAVRDIGLNRICRDVLVRSVRHDPPAGLGPISQTYEVDDGAGGLPGQILLSLAPDWTGGILLPEDGGRREIRFDGRACVWLDANGDRIPLSSTESRQLPAAVLVQAIMAVNGGEWFPVCGESLVDGSDRAAGRPAIRLKAVDAGHDWFYLWVSTGFADEDSGGRGELLRAAADRDCDGAGGIVFQGWVERGGWMLPSAWSEVTGLDEIPHRRWKLREPDE